MERENGWIRIAERGVRGGTKRSIILRAVGGVMFSGGFEEKVSFPRVFLLRMGVTK